MSINKNKQKTYLLSILDFHIRIIPSPLMFHPTNFILDFLRVKEKGKEKNIIFNYLVVYSLVACSYKVNEVSPDRRIYSYKNCCVLKNYIPASCDSYPHPSKREKIKTHPSGIDPNMM